MESGLPSPCPAGLIRPAIYLTPTAIASPEGLRHVIAHEETHARHLDPLWSLLRCVCLTVYWFDPLVWAAAFASKTDCELACDEGALRRLGESERIPYGRTLLSLIPVRHAPGNPLLTATTMTAEKRQLKDRITRIAENRQTVTTALFAAAALVALVCAVTFTGGSDSPAPDTDTPPTVSGDLTVPGTDTPTIYPEGEPWMTIPLTDLTPIEPQPVELVHRSNDCAERGDSIWYTDSITVQSYLSTDGNAYAAIVRKETPWDVDCFYTFPGTYMLDYEIGGFSNLFGYEGFYVSTDSDNGLMQQFYILDQHDQPMFLTSVYGYQNAMILDLNGDGVTELVSDGTQIVFQQDGQIYATEISPLLYDNWPENSYIEFNPWDTEKRCMILTGFISMPEWGENAQAWSTRWMYFDGENLLLYKDTRKTVDHVLEGTGDVPEDVIAAAKAQVISVYQSGVMDQDFDDWRISYLEKVDYDLGYDLDLEIYSFGYQLHLASPGDAVWAGGTYVDESGWYGGFNEGSPYLIFLAEGDKRTLLNHDIPNDTFPEAPAFRGEMGYLLLDHGLLQPQDISTGDLVHMFYPNAVTFFNTMAEYGDDQLYPLLQRLAAHYQTLSAPDCAYIDDPLQYIMWNGSDLTEAGRRAYRLLLPMLGSGLSEPAQQAQAVLDAIVADGNVTMSYNGKSYTASKDYGNGPNRLYTFPYSYRFYPTEGGYPDTSDALKVSSTDGSAAFYCWPNSLAVFCTLGNTEIWLMAQPVEDTPLDDSLFQFFRFWFDEMELSALSQDIVIPDEGQSHLEIAQEWTNQKIRTGMQVSAGSKYALTYVRAVASVEGWEEMTYYPEWTEGHERFYFSYDRIFVPENDYAENWQMAGNTGDYAGEHGPAPEGAFINYQMGVLSLTDEGWRCEGTGTGP